MLRRCNTGRNTRCVAFAVTVCVVAFCVMYSVSPLRCPVVTVVLLHFALCSVCCDCLCYRILRYVAFPHRAAMLSLLFYRISGFALSGRGRLPYQNTVKYTSKLTECADLHQIMETGAE